MSKDEILAVIRTGVANKQSQGEISRQLGKSPSYVSSMMRANGIKPARPDRDMSEVGRSRPGNERLDFIREQLKRFNQAEVAKIIGVTRQRLSQLVKKHKLTTIPRQTLIQTRILEVAKSSNSLQEALPILELSPQCVIRHLKETPEGKAILHSWKLDRVNGKKDSVLNAFKQLADKLGRTPTQVDINNDSECPSHPEFYRLFGSLDAVAVALGLPANRRGGWRKGMRQSHCHAGHELEGDNVYEYRNPKTGYVSRMCRACRRVRNAK
jgi:hypothetical protein